MNTRNAILSAILALATAVEFCFNMGERFGQWFRNGGKEQIISAISYVIAAIIWTVETVTMGAKVLYRNRVAIMETAGRPFIYS